MRVYEYAKLIGKDTKDVISALKEHGIDLKSASNIDDKAQDVVGKHFAKTQESARKEEPKQTPVKKQEVKPQETKPQETKPQETKSQETKSQENKMLEKKPAASGNETAAQEKSHITRVFNPQNSERGRNGQGYNRDGQNRGQGYNRDGQNGYNRDGQNRGQGYNRDGQNRGQGYNRDGQNGYNRDGQNRGQGYNRDGQNSQNGYNRDGQNRGQGYNRDGQNRGQGYNRDGQNGYNRDGQNRGQGYNRDGQGYNRDGQNRSQGYNRDGQGYNRDGQNRGQGYNRDGQNGYNRDSQNRGQGYNRDGQNGYNKDGQNRGQGYNRDGQNRGQGYNRDGQNRGQGFNRDNSRNRDSKPDFAFEKPDARKPESRRTDNNKNNQKNRDKKEKEKENLKFASQKPGQFIKPKKVETPVEPEETIKTLVLPDTLTIQELGDKMKVQPSVIVKKLFMQGKMVTINQEIDFDTAEEIALEFNCICEHEVKVDVIAELLKEQEESENLMTERPPVVCVMGHVDHGKTSLLDAIRSTNVTARESGGITQHIGAYMVEINGRRITFLDTPGHEAFTAMRMRGANATDIAILVVAADDGVMPQTIEAINHAKAAGIDIIVAVNKIDKPNANVEKVKQELTEYGLIAEDWGGDTIFVPVSAHTKEGIDSLLEMVLLTADVRELKANPNRKARGLVIEAKLDKGRGPVATILVQKGTLKVGDNVAAGSCYGKIRAMVDENGRRLKEATPSTPVEILGLNDVPNAGEVIVATENEKEARSFAETFIAESKKKLIDDTKAKLSLDDLFSQIQAGNLKELDIIIKADVQGSVEAVKQSLLKLSNEEVVVKVIHGGVGNINESDVVLASASNAIIIGFNVKPDNQARAIADREKVDLRLYKVIYNAIEDVEAAMKGMLDPKYEEKVIGKGEVRQTFKASGVGVIAGVYITDGKITKNASVRLKRADEVLYDGALASLKRFKDDVKEVKEGYDCGIVLEKFNDIQELDTIEVYIMEEIPR